MNFSVPQSIVQQSACLLGAEQHRVELDDAVEPVLLHQVLDDALDLIRWAAVKGAQGYRVGESVRELEIAKLGQIVGNLLP